MLTIDVEDDFFEEHKEDLFKDFFCQKEFGNTYENVHYLIDRGNAVLKASDMSQTGNCFKEFSEDEIKLYLKENTVSYDDAMAIIERLLNK